MRFQTDDAELLAGALREAGSIALQYFRNSVSAWTKEDGTPVSAADIAINEHLKHRLLAHRPDYGWLSEETEKQDTQTSARRVWVVDPIDGTRAFIDGVPHFCHSVALVEEGRPVVAALHNPAADELYEAVAGKGAKLNGREIRVSHRAEIAGCRMAAFAPLFKHPAWREPWPDMEIVQRDSVAYRLAMVASGEVDAALSLNAKRDWDLAAADLIVHEAGGLLTSHDGHRLHYNTGSTTHRSFLAAGPVMYNELFAKIGHIELRRPQNRAD
jgi:myo-inositol-1(or 4)-monophosphatase